MPVSAVLLDPILPQVLQLIPISDVNPTRRFSIVTLALIALNVLAFIQEPGFGMGDRATVYFFESAPIPCQAIDTCPRGLIAEGLRIPERDMVSFMLSVVFSTFLHAGPLHLAGNMLFLWVFGNNIEDYLGHIRYVLFYLVGGIVASLAHIGWTLATAADRCTNADFAACIPSVGASGAVAAVMGAYILLYPRARVNVLVPIFILWTVIQMSALTVLGIWLVYQFLIGSQELSGASEVAWMAHVGGFVFGVIGILLLGGRPHRPRPAWAPDWD